MTAKIPRVLPAVGWYPLLTEAVVDIRFASPKSMPVVTAIWPIRLYLWECIRVEYCDGPSKAYHPVIQAKKGAFGCGANM